MPVASSQWQQRPDCPVASVPPCKLLLAIAGRSQGARSHSPAQSRHCASLLPDRGFSTGGRSQQREAPEGTASSRKTHSQKGTDKTRDNPHSCSPTHLPSYTPQKHLLPPPPYCASPRAICTITGATPRDARTKEATQHGTADGLLNLPRHLCQIRVEFACLQPAST